MLNLSSRTRVRYYCKMLGSFWSSIIIPLISSSSAGVVPDTLVRSAEIRSLDARLRKSSYIITTKSDALRFLATRPSPDRCDQKENEDRENRTDLEDDLGGKMLRKR